MREHKLWLVVILPLLAACAGPKPAARRTVSVEDVNGIRSRADSADRDPGAGTKAAPPETAPLQAAALPPSASVKIIKKTPEVLEFEAEGEGISTKYEPPVEAEKRAEEDALSKAVKEAGVNVYSGMQDVMSQYGSTSYQFVGKYSSTWSNALISYEKTGTVACSLAGDIYKCTVQIHGRVYFKGSPDPNFELKADLGKPGYFEGDSVSLKVSVSEDAYITVLDCDEDGNISLLFPNRQARDNFLPAGKVLTIPDDLNFKLQAMLSHGRSEGDLLHVIATKKQPLVLLDSVKEENEGIFETYSMGGLKDMVTKLSRLNRTDWTAQVIVYEVKKK